MKIFYTDHFVLPLPAGHRFPMEKYALLRQRVMDAGLVPPHKLCIPQAATNAQLLRAHDATYLDRVVRGRLSDREIRRLGFPWSPQLVERSRRSVGSTIEASRAALVDGLAVNLAGGTHHAFRDRGEGFCVFNDSVVAARAMQAEGRACRVAIIDCDVHQGNGTAAIVADDPTIFTFSIHGAKNYPYDKERSDLDVALPTGAGDRVYLDALSSGLARTLERSDAELVIYLAGADPYLDDRLGRLAVSKEGLAARDRMVFEGCCAAEVPVVVTMSGGYARHVDDTVGIHLCTVALAARIQAAMRPSAHPPEASEHVAA